MSRTDRPERTPHPQPGRVRRGPGGRLGVRAGGGRPAAPRPPEGGPAAVRRLVAAAARTLAAAARSRAGRAGVLLAVAGLGAVLSVAVAGSTTAPVGPVDARLSVRLSWTGDSVLEVPPLGSLTLDSHDGPFQLRARIVQVEAADARRILGDPASLAGLDDRVVADLRAAVVGLILRAALVAVAGAALAVLLVLRRTRRALAGAGLAVGLAAAGGGAAAATFDPRALSSPRYDGLLTIAPTLVGSVESIVGDFGRYSEQLAQIVTNVSRLYDATTTLPAYSADPSTVRVLVVSDIHLNPAAFDVMRSVAEQFQTDFVVDAGDLTDHGSAPENQFTGLIATMGQPYVFVRGNHDSLGTQRAVARQRNAIVLRDGQSAQVEGIRVAGAGDPRFTPDKSTRDRPPARTVEQAGADLAATLRGQAAAGREVDLAVVHDPAMALPLDGAVPLVVSGHGHEREVRVLDGGTRLFEQGSTGGAGLRGLEGEEPTPVQLSVLYLDQESGALRAWDDIDMGGLGLASAKIERHLAEEQTRAPADGPAPVRPEARRLR